MILTIRDIAFSLKSNNEEILPIDALDTPYICVNTDMDKAYINRRFPWHWHTSLEINYIEEGEVAFRIADDDFCIKKGEAVFINSEVLHDVRAAKSFGRCLYFTHLFEPSSICGEYGNKLYEKYMSPVISNKNMPYYILRADSYRRVRMMEIILQVINLSQEEPFGWEFEIRSELSRFWCMLLEETEDIRGMASQSPINTNSERLKNMMRFIHAHYSEKISLEDIASSSNISQRECSRCFKSCIKLSPMEYLKRYRIHMAASMLIQTDDNIIEISENCGFHSCSYFAKRFEEVMDCTPLKYRKARQALGRGT